MKPKINHRNPIKRNNSDSVRIEFVHFVFACALPVLTHLYDRVSASVSVIPFWVHKEKLNAGKMFKKLKDKIAEEVKSSPSRIQELAKVAQVIFGGWDSATTVYLAIDEKRNSTAKMFNPNDKPLECPHTHTHV